MRIGEVATWLREHTPSASENVPEAPDLSEAHGWCSYSGRQHAESDNSGFLRFGEPVGGLWLAMSQAVWAAAWVRAVAVGLAPHMSMRGQPQCVIRSGGGLVGGCLLDLGGDLGELGLCGHEF